MLNEPIIKLNALKNVTNVLANGTASVVFIVFGTVHYAAAIPLAAGFEEIYFPGELEDRSRARLEREGIELPDKTMEALERLAAETGVELAFGR